MAAHAEPWAVARHFVMTSSRMKTFPAVLLSLLLAISLRAQDKLTPAPVAPAPGGGDAAAEKAILDKLNTIIIPQINFREATVPEGLEYLQRKSAELDNGPATAAKGVALACKRTESSIGVATPPEAKVTMTLSNIPLGEALHYFAFLAGQQIEIGPQGVVFSTPPGGQAPKDDPIAAALRAGDNTATAARLATIILPRMEMRNAVMPEALEWMRLMSRANDHAEPDPAKKGINIVFQPAPPGRVPRSTPLPDGKITLSLQNIPVGEALRFACGMAGYQYIIEPHAVLVVPVDEP